MFFEILSNIFMSVKAFFYVIIMGIFFIMIRIFKYLRFCLIYFLVFSIKALILVKVKGKLVYIIGIRKIIDKTKE